VLTVRSYFVCRPAESSCLVTTDALNDAIILRALKRFTKNNENVDQKRDPPFLD